MSVVPVGSQLGQAVQCPLYLVHLFIGLCLLESSCSKVSAEDGDPLPGEADLRGEETFSWGRGMGREEQDRFDHFSSPLEPLRAVEVPESYVLDICSMPRRCVWLGCDVDEEVIHDGRKVKNGKGCGTDLEDILGNSGERGNPQYTALSGPVFTAPDQDVEQPLFHPGDQDDGFVFVGCVVHSACFREPSVPGISDGLSISPREAVFTVKLAHSASPLIVGPAAENSPG